MVIQPLFSDNMAGGVGTMDLSREENSWGSSTFGFSAHSMFQTGVCKSVFPLFQVIRNAKQLEDFLFDISIFNQDTNVTVLQSGIFDTFALA